MKIKSTTFSLPTILLVLVLSPSCQTKPGIDEIYNGLKPNQAKAIIQIDGIDFYSPESIFSGKVDVSETFFRTNLTDQFESNIIVSFSGDNWYQQKPIKRQVFMDNQVVGSVMIGKLTDKINRRGEGYLMTEGDIAVETISDDRLVLRLTGKVGRYQFQRTPEKWNTLRGLIVFKKPSLRLQNLTKKEVYF
jgi:hypothetical protein